MPAIEAIAGVSQSVLDELVSRIVDAVHPTRILLFGSAARGKMGPDSDLDLLVVMPDGTHRGDAAQTIYRNLSGLGFAHDIVVATEQDIESHGNDFSLVLYPALREGRELYRDSETREPLECDMTPERDDWIPGSVQTWLARSNGDLALARVPLPEGAFYEDLCYHAQQAAEKAIKAVFIAHGWRFRYIHDIGDLLDGLRHCGLEVREDVAKARALTRYASEARYPDRSTSVTESDYRLAVELAETVVRWAESCIADMTCAEPT
jgi:HEPN domain-containing protein/predicted nucleotidyltransferase